jgi:hypothetical protein
MYNSNSTHTCCMFVCQWLIMKCENYIQNLYQMLTKTNFIEQSPSWGVDGCSAG